MLLRILALAFVMLAWDASPGRAADWKRLDTPNFVVIGNVGARDLTAVGRQFEAFRATLTRLLGQRATGSAVPTVVFVFASDRDFAPYKLLFNGKPVEISGLCMAGPDVNQIALVQFSDESVTQVIFHEYTHELVANLFRDAPVWFTEGMAEYYSSFEMRDDGRRAMIGRPLASRLMALGESTLLPVETLITVGPQSPLYNEGSERSLFYAQSWALVHFLLSDDTRRAQLGTYLGLVSQHAPPADAWRQVFGPDVDEALRQYIRRVAFASMQVDFADRIAVFDGRPVPMKDVDARVALTGLLIGQRRLDDADRRLAEAARLDPGNPRLAARRAQVMLARGDRAAAGRTVAAAGPAGLAADWLVAYEAGVLMTRVVDRPGVEIAPAEMALTRALFDEVQRQRGDIANVLARRASLVLWTSDVPSADAVQAVDRARALAPGREEYAFLHAQLLARRGGFADARNILGAYLGANVAPDVRELARTIMVNIVQLETNVRLRQEIQGARDRAAASPAATAPPTGAGADVVSAGSGVPPATMPLLRPLKPGEQRLEGTLERIECAKDGAVTFRIRTGAGMTTARANLLSYVEFITYRRDAGGTVACGGPKAPMPVAVTWRPGAPAGTRYAVAVEFLPVSR